ncbi:MAG: small ribosomal subunit Rsm22 family protein [bacterium]|nr:small ribosomal subunit Rsm22 family protein [bacterium]MBU1918986.1 small ribosomal subunit Rsm22 family protein [bacterium]
MNKSWQLFESNLKIYLKNNYLKKTRAQADWIKQDTQYFSKGVIRLNELFTTQRTQRRFNYFDDPVLRSGYLAYFLPVNAYKVYHLLRTNHSHIHLKDKIRIVDLASGPLTMSFGFLLYLLDKGLAQNKTIQIEIMAFEQNKKILNDGIKLMKAFLFVLKGNSDLDIRVHITPCQTDLNRSIPERKPCDILFSGNFFNELSTREQQITAMDRFIRSFCHQDTLMVFIEPGTKKISRDLQELRDAFHAERTWRVLAPCVCHNSCPFNIVHKGDWCHHEIEWQTPSYIQDFDKAVGLKKQYLLYSYLMLTNRLVQKAAVVKKDVYVAVSHIMSMKDGYEFLGCGVDGLTRFQLFTNNISQNNHAFKKLRRGSVFKFQICSEKKDVKEGFLYQIKKTDCFRIL